MPKPIAGDPYADYFSAMLGSNYFIQSFEDLRYFFLVGGRNPFA